MREKNRLWDGTFKEGSRWRETYVALQLSDYLTYDIVFVKMVLSQLFASKVWQSFNIHTLSIWCDNAPHFRN
jgi:hypothetical protein